MTWKTVVTDYGFPDVASERRIIEAAGGTLEEQQCKTAESVVATCADADALLVQWAPITADVVRNLTRCRVIVRYGIGVDNVDLQAAAEKGIAVCNVPDYGINEVADHAIALALALGRQLPQIDARTRQGFWKLAPVTAMPAFHQMTFGTLGFGRIGRSVLERARPFGFRLASYDPFVSPETIESQGISYLSLEDAIREADILSLHLPLTPETQHLINAVRLGTMKRTAVLINTARGALIDTHALAQALQAATIAYAGLDVFETEPLPEGHPLLQCSNALLTSHVAWYSEASIPKLQTLAAEEIVRVLQGQSPHNRVN